ncbi:MAG: hypothetical protein AAF358_09980 [Pseudomonadota bacterium]
MRRTRALGLLCVFCLAVSSVGARGLSIRPELSIEARGFADEPQFPDQLATAQLGVVLTGQASWRSRDRKTRFDFEPYIRLDNRDSRRTYADIRELSFSKDFGTWDVLFGVSQVFWGVAESRNVVDVINQIDAVEDLDEGEKLGQPMLRAARSLGPGNIELFYLPYFRERAFAGRDGRLRFSPTVDASNISYERDGEAWAGDWALRYTQRRGALDLGLHAFSGTNRNPFLALSESGERLLQTYQSLDQVGVDLQLTRGAWLLKGEWVAAESGGNSYRIWVAGFEYTLFGLGGTAADLGLIAEHLRDTRDLTKAPITVFDDDTFAGLRLTLNDSQDTELLAGLIRDHRTSAIQYSAEFQRRIGARNLLELEARVFSGGDDTLITAFSADDFLTARWTVFF